MFQYPVPVMRPVLVKPGNHGNVQHIKVSNYLKNIKGLLVFCFNFVKSEFVRLCLNLEFCSQEPGDHHKLK